MIICDPRRFSQYHDTPFHTLCRLCQKKETVSGTNPLLVLISKTALGSAGPNITPFYCGKTGLDGNLMTYVKF